MDGKTKGQPCGIEGCRSRRYDEGEDGFLYCENGHRSGQLLAAEDDDNFLGAQRRDKTRRRRDDEDDEPGRTQLKGRDALDLYLQTLQLILRHQIWFLVRDKGLPAELETVVLDMWSLRIMQLEERVGESQGYDSQSQFLTSESEEDQDNEVAKLVVRQKKLKATPSLMECLALCYLGIVTLRLPITPGDINVWVTDGNLVYWKALKILPIAMIQKLPSYYHAVLSPNSGLKFGRFYVTVMNMAVNFSTEYGLIWPSLNYPLLLFRFMKELALPLEIYDATIRLAQVLDYNLTIPTKASRDHLGIRHIPEVQLVACLVVCVKVLYPFDGQRRYPRTAAEPAAATLSWGKWREHLASAKASRQDNTAIYTSADLMDIKEKDVFSMTDNQMDQYLDWYQDNLLDQHQMSHNKDTNFRQALYDFFPIDSTHTPQPPRSVCQTPSHQEAMNTVSAVHGDLSSRTVIGDDDANPSTLRPGQNHAYYKEEKDLPEAAKWFYEEVAQLMGLELGMLVKAVFFAEKKVERWSIKQKQQARTKTEAHG